MHYGALASYAMADQGEGPGSGRGGVMHIREGTKYFFSLVLL